MSALAVDMHLDFWTAPAPEAASAPALVAVPRNEPVGGERTLEDLVLSAWEGLAAHRTVSCPVCAGQMRPRPAVAEQRAGGHCRDCGTWLS